MRWNDQPNYSGRRRVVFPQRVRDGLFRAHKGRCAYCGRTQRHLEIDHKHPVSRGGGDEVENLQLLCNSCNMRKGIQTDKEFRYRYQRLLPADGSIPSPSIPQDRLSEETQRTRASKEVRAIYNAHFTAARERQRAKVPSEVRTAPPHKRVPIWARETQRASAPSEVRSTPSAPVHPARYVLHLALLRPVNAKLSAPGRPERYVLPLRPERQRTRAPEMCSVCSVCLPS